MCTVGLKGWVGAVVVLGRGSLNAPANIPKELVHCSTWESDTQRSPYRLQTPLTTWRHHCLPHTVDGQVTHSSTACPPHPPALRIPKSSNSQARARQGVGMQLRLENAKPSSHNTFNVLKWPFKKPHVRRLCRLLKVRSFTFQALLAARAQGLMTMARTPAAVNPAECFGRVYGLSKGVLG